MTIINEILDVKMNEVVNYKKTEILDLIQGLLKDSLKNKPEAALQKEYSDINEWIHRD